MLYTNIPSHVMNQNTDPRNHAKTENAKNRHRIKVIGHIENANETYSKNNVQQCGCHAESSTAQNSIDHKIKNNG